MHLKAINNQNFKLNKNLKAYEERLLFMVFKYFHFGIKLCYFLFLCIHDLVLTLMLRYFRYKLRKNIIREIFCI